MARAQPQTGPGPPSTCASLSIPSPLGTRKGEAQGEALSQLLQHPLPTKHYGAAVWGQQREQARPLPGVLFRHPQASGFLEWQGPAPIR